MSAELRSQLQIAWHKVIDGPYRDGLINSERGLQVHFCMALLEAFGNLKSSRRFFIEPSVKVEGQKTRYPDMIICDTESVIAIIELKYAPRKKPGNKKDIDTLSVLAAAKADVRISNRRFRGKPLPEYRYPFTHDVVLCWAGVYTGKKLELPPISSDLGEHFLRLDAITVHGEDAIISAN